MDAATVRPLLRLSEDVLETIGLTIWNVLQPAAAGALAACCRDMRRVMRAPLAKLLQRHAAAKALGRKVGLSLAQMGVATTLRWKRRSMLLVAHDMATLGMLFSTGALPRVERLTLDDHGLGGEGAAALFDRLACGAGPNLVYLSLQANKLGGAGASAFAAALARGALPKLASLELSLNQLGDEGLATLARALRRRPAIRRVDISKNGIGDAGLTALIGKLGSTELKHLEALNLHSNRLGDAGCAALAAALTEGTLPALGRARGITGMRQLPVLINPASAAAQQAVHSALRANEARAAA